MWLVTRSLPSHKNRRWRRFFLLLIQIGRMAAFRKDHHRQKIDRLEAATAAAPALLMIGDLQNFLFYCQLQFGQSLEEDEQKISCLIMVGVYNKTGNHGDGGEQLKRNVN